MTTISSRRTFVTNSRFVRNSITSDAYPLYNLHFSPWRSFQKLSHNREHLRFLQQKEYTTIRFLCALIFVYDLISFYRNLLRPPVISRRLPQTKYTVEIIRIGPLTKPSSRVFGSSLLQSHPPPPSTLIFRILTKGFFLPKRLQDLSAVWTTPVTGSRGERSAPPRRVCPCPGRIVWTANSSANRWPARSWSRRNTPTWSPRYPSACWRAYRWAGSRNKGWPRRRWCRWSSGTPRAKRWRSRARPGTRSAATASATSTTWSGISSTWRRSTRTRARTTFTGWSWVEPSPAYKRSSRSRRRARSLADGRNECEFDRETIYHMYTFILHVHLTISFSRYRFILTVRFMNVFASSRRNERPIITIKPH